MSKRAVKTPLRHVLHERSSLHASIEDGMDAVSKSHRTYFDESIRSTFADSLELDEALRSGRDQENRWDYLMGHAPSGEVIAVEPHSKWLWVASGKVHFAETEKAKLRLDQNGIEFVGTRVMAKHLPVAAATVSAVRPRPKRRK